MTKKQRYLQIAAKHTPDFLRAIPVTGDGYHGMAHAHDENEENWAK
jgi:hypothetical protein